MYETALENSASKRKVVEQLKAEYRAGKIPELPEKPKTTTRKWGNIKMKASNGKAILDSFRNTAAKAETNIKELSSKVTALDAEISRLQMRNTLQHAPEIKRKQQEKADLVKRISALQDIRARCLKQGRA